MGSKERRLSYSIAFKIEVVNYPENDHEEILVAVTTISWVSMMNKLYYGCYFWYVTILFSSNKLLKLKYIYRYFFSKIPNEKITVRLWTGK